MTIIETKNLSFSFGKKEILKNISLQIPEGAIYGLLGKNGAGKSTTLKLLLNLLPSPKGTISLLGNSDYDHNIFYRIGNLIETPALYGYMSVEEHLKMLNILFKQESTRIDEVLEIVGLENEKKKKASKLSTGLKQRLGLAMAIFRNPDILILDEPINGLDPLGIIDVRNLLLKLQGQGKTILLSSHIIAEMEKICTHVGIIENGELKFQGTISQIGDQSLESFYIDIIKKG